MIRIGIIDDEEKMRNQIQQCVQKVTNQLKQIEILWLNN